MQRWGWSYFWAKTTSAWLCRAGQVCERMTLAKKSWAVLFRVGTRCPESALGSVLQERGTLFTIESFIFKLKLSLKLFSMLFTVFQHLTE